MKIGTLRWISILLTIVMVISLFGCKPADQGSEPTTGSNDTTVGGTTPEDNTPEVCYDGSPVTIQFTHDFNSKKQQLLDAAIAQFNTLYPNIEVIHMSAGSMEDVHTQTTMLLDNGNAANIVLCQPSHVASYLEKGAVTALDDLIGSNAELPYGEGSTGIFGLTAEQKGDFVESFYAEGSAYGDGKMYSMPLYRYAQVLYYNKEFFDLNGITAPSTWEEMEAVCQKIRQIDPESTPLLISDGDALYYELCAQYGMEITGGKTLFTGETPVQILTQLREWEQQQYLDLDVSAVSLDEYYRFTGESNDPRCYMVISQSYAPQYFYLDSEVGIASVPRMDGTGIQTEGPSLCILESENAQETLAAWLFVKFLTTNADFQTELAMQGCYIPVLNSAAQDPEYSAFLAAADGRENLNGRVSVFLCDNKDFWAVSPAADGKDLRDQVEQLLDQCLYQGGQIESELQKLADQYKEE